MSTPVRPLKALGQHFLNSPETAARIAGSLQINDSFDTILEIGPGTGVLTSLLKLHTDKKFYCIDVDQRSVAYLEAAYPELVGRIVAGDFLNHSLDFLGSGNFAVIGNFPYNISSQILFRILDMYKRVPQVVGMFQKEVAERIASPAGSRDYGILSVLLQAHYDIEYLFTVPPEVFIPPPKVQSGVIRMTLKENPELPCDPVVFKQVIKTAFNQRRKTMRNSLKSILPLDTSEVPFLQMRPEQLDYTQFILLTQILQRLRLHS